MEKLRSLNYLNDETFARDWARSKAENRGYGPERIAQELKTKGIPETLARQVVGEVFVPGQEVARAKMLLDRRFKYQQFNDPKTLRRAIS
ncbi:MAG: regulatory protein RecX, partial [Candidatus Binatia bacterium]|nr:regulatory protein RecX [Candidatus Binatia bacterium]